MGSVWSTSTRATWGHTRCWDRRLRIPQPCEDVVHKHDVQHGSAYRPHYTGTWGFLGPIYPWQIGGVFPVWRWKAQWFYPNLRLGNSRSPGVNARTQLGNRHSLRYSEAIPGKHRRCHFIPSRSPSHQSSSATKTSYSMLAPPARTKAHTFSVSHLAVFARRDSSQYIRPLWCREVHPQLFQQVWPEPGLETALWTFQAALVWSWGRSQGATTASGSRGTKKCQHQS